MRREGYLECFSRGDFTWPEGGALRLPAGEQMLCSWDQVEDLLRCDMRLEYLAPTCSEVRSKVEFPIPACHIGVHDLRCSQGAQPKKWEGAGVCRHCIGSDCGALPTYQARRDRPLVPGSHLRHHAVGVISLQRMMFVASFHRNLI